LVEHISKKVLEKYAYQIREAIKEARFGLVIPESADYDDNMIKSINRDWEKVSKALDKARGLVDELLNLIGAVII
jgi:hypothetical protein